MARRATTILLTGSNPVEPVGPLARWPVRSTNRLNGPTGSTGLTGLTLIEVLLSLAILAIGQVVILQALARGAYALASAERSSTAYAFAAAKLAEVDASLQDGGAPRTSGSFQSSTTSFQWALERSPLPDEPRLELVTLAITWRQGRHPYESRLSLVHPAPEVPDAS